MENLEQCKKAELYNQDGLVCEATVDNGTAGSLQLVVPRSLPLGRENSYTIKFYDSSAGILTCRCVLSSPLDLPDNLWSVRCEILETIEQLQRRQDVKVYCDIHFMLHVERRPGDFYIPLKGWPGRIKNISAGGVYFQTDLSLNAGRQIEFEFYETEEKLQLMARILRIEDLTEQPNQPMYGYGCKFVCLSARAENQLRNYVFREERRRRSKLNELN